MRCRRAASGYDGSTWETTVAASAGVPGPLSFLTAEAGSTPPTPAVKLLSCGVAWKICLPFWYTARLPGGKEARGAPWLGLAGAEVVLSVLLEDVPSVDGWFEVESMTLDAAGTLTS